MFQPDSPSIENESPRVNAVVVGNMENKHLVCHILMDIQGEIKEKLADLWYRAGWDSVDEFETSLQTGLLRDGIPRAVIAKNILPDEAELLRSQLVRLESNGFRIEIEESDDIASPKPIADEPISLLLSNIAAKMGIKVEQCVSDEEIKGFTRVEVVSSAAAEDDKNLHTVQISKLEEGNVCGICMEMFQVEDVLIQLPMCGHYFHATCTRGCKGLVEVLSERNTCPSVWCNKIVTSKPKIAKHKLKEDLRQAVDTKPELFRKVVEDIQIDPR